MTKIVCPECNTQVYDDLSFFCYKCGAQLPVKIQKKKNARDLNPGLQIFKKESRGARDEALLSRKPGSIRRFRPIEICARCGAPITDKNKVFCSGCTAYIRDMPPGEESPFVQLPVFHLPEESPGGMPGIYQDTAYKTPKEQEPVPARRTGKLFSTTSRPKVVIVVAAIVILLFVLLMIVMLMFTFWASLY